MVNGNEVGINGSAVIKRLFLGLEKREILWIWIRSPWRFEEGGAEKEPLARRAW
jgi:hypothetical protein